MNTVLFTYNRRVEVNGVVKNNTNYINPLNVISFFWEDVEGEDGKSKAVLSVFLNAVRTDPRSGNTNSYSIRFGQGVGEKFVQHMEDFLRYLIAAPMVRAANTNIANDNNRNTNRSRRVVDADVIEEDTTTATPVTAWVDN